jgi:hypothetical protein
MKLLLFLFLFFLPLVTFGQSLYLKIDASQPKQLSGSWHLNTKNNKYRKVYEYQAMKNGLWFVCDDKATDSQILPISQIGTYAVKTITELENMTSHLSSRKALNWFGQFDTIYIVEILLSGTHFELSKVRLFTIGM